MSFKLQVTLVDEQAVRYHVTGKIQVRQAVVVDVAHLHRHRCRNIHSDSN